MQLNPHLTFNGQCEAAFKYYEKCLGGRIVVMMTYGDSPVAKQTSPGWEKKILHATFALGPGRAFTGGDVPPAAYQEPRGFSVLLAVDTAPEADRIFKMLAEQGTVQMALEETFWALRFGMLVDQFGTPWMIQCGKPS
jgi:PhnB protein